MIRIFSPIYPMWGALFSTLLLCSCGSIGTKAPSLADTDQPQPHADANPLDALCVQSDADKAEQGEWQEYDIWERIRSQYQLEFEQNKTIDAHLTWINKHPNYVNRVSLRGERYLHYIVSELERRELPMELALLPIVESAFDPFAYSHGRASGMWQIIPGTGKMLGLKQTWWYDGRRDVTASTHAALDYLEKLNKQFNGNWYLALAAYNSGAATVKRAIRKNKRAGKPTTFWDLSLPRETRGYVPRLLALAKIYQEPLAYGIILPPVKNQPYFAEVDVKAQIDLAQAAELAEISMDDLYKLNPGFNRWATDPAGPHTLLIPVDKEQIFRENLAAVPAEERVTWRRYNIRQGETLSQIARKYNISVATLQSINNIKGTTIRAGKTLMVPTAKKGSSFYSQSAEQRLARKQNKGAKTGKQRIDHTVVSGDSFWKIAKRYGVNSKSIAKWNNMAPRDTLSIGQKLAIWTNDLSQSTPKQTQNHQQVIRKLSYKVRKGDSLHKIANKFRLNVNDIVKWNQLSANKYLQPGQALVLFVDVRGS